MMTLTDAVYSAKPLAIYHRNDSSVSARARTDDASLPCCCKSIPEILPFVSAEASTALQRLNNDRLARKAKLFWSGENTARFSEAFIWVFFRSATRAYG